MEFWRHRVLTTYQTVPGEPVQKKFTPKFDLPKLTNYRTDPGDEFWQKMPDNRGGVGKSLINHIKLESMARCLDLDLDSVPQLPLVIEDLKNGAKLGCRGEARAGSYSTNADSCYEFGEEITDSIATMLKRNIAAGPFRKEEVPREAKINGMMCRIKPNGACRIILNLSAPLGSSVNDGIDTAEFPAKMSSTSKWLACLNRAGRGCLMTKMDWEIAYKHIHVAREDLPLQWFHWMDRYFCELALIFGAASSPGIYDRCAKVVLEMALKLSRMPRAAVCQYLDDVCAAASPTSKPGVHEFRDAYLKIAETVGVIMSPEDDPEKAFAPRTSGTVLGISYNTVEWTWSIPADKLNRLLRQIDAALSADTLKQADVWSVVGKIIHYAPLLVTGRYNLDYLIKANNFSTHKKAEVPICANTKRQLWFWRTMLLATSGLASIPVLPETVPAWALEFFTDAAGGSLSTPGLGCGGVSVGWWFMLPWSWRINGTTIFEGRRLAQKLSALELVGPLVCLCADPEMVRNKPIRIFVDNAGSVSIWKKGYSSACSLSTTLVKAMATVAAALGCTVALEKISRCSCIGSSLADALSKSAFARFDQLAAGWNLPLEPATVPMAVIRWVENPTPDDALGEKILVDMRKTHLILGYNC